MPPMTTSPKPNPYFALPHAPAETLDIAGATYRIDTVFKHDFWAAACLYVTDDPAAEFSKIVVKFGRAHRWKLVPLRWLGRWMIGHECRIYEKLDGLAPAIPAYLGRLDAVSFAMEYVDANPLDHCDTPPEGFFDRLVALFQAVHGRKVAYVDSNKRSNILVRPSGEPCLIDFQISQRRTILNWWFLRYLQRKDIYHALKHKRRMAPDELREDEIAASQRSGLLHKIHAKVSKGYRAIRRKFLRKKYQSGNLDSPTADLETHHQPEKESWRD
jgi:hypothetical protein